MVVCGSLAAPASALVLIVESFARYNLLLDVAFAIEHPVKHVSIDMAPIGVPHPVVLKFADEAVSSFEEENDCILEFLVCFSVEVLVTIVYEMNDVFNLCSHCSVLSRRSLSMVIIYYYHESLSSAITIFFQEF